MWVLSDQLLHQLAAAHGGHDHIGQDQLDGKSGSGDGQRMFWILSDDHFVAVGSQNGVGQVANRFFVFHQQNCLGAFLRFGFQAHRGRNFDRRFHTRQIDFEGRAKPRLAVHPDVAAALFDDAIAGCQSETGAPRTTFGGKERFENMGHGFRAHAQAAVADSEHHVSPWFYADMLAGVCLVQVDVASFDHQPSAARHGVARVHHQVHQHLFDLRWVGLDGADIRRKFAVNPDVFAHQPAQQLLQAVHNAVEINILWLQNLLAAERQQLMYQGCGTFAGIVDALDIVSKSGLAFGTLARQFGIALDDGQQIVEVVCDAPSQASDSFHPARLLRLHLHQLALADVHQQAFHHWVILAAFSDGGGVADPNGRAVFASQAVFRLERLSLQAGLLGFLYRRMIVRVNIFQPVFRIGEPLFRRIAEDGFDLRADVKPAAGDARRGDVADRGYLLDNHSILALGFGAGLFRFSPLAQIAAEQHYATFGQRGYRQFHRNQGAPARKFDDSQPAAVLFYGRADFFGESVLDFLSGDFHGLSANHLLAGNRAEQLRVDFIYVGISAVRSDDGHPVCGQIQGLRLLPDHLGILRFAEVADGHARHIAADGDGQQ